MINPHFDQQRVIWKDEYSGEYAPIDYSDQFDPEWKLFLDQQQGFTQHVGVETGDEWIDDRIFDLTGVHGLLAPGKATANRDLGGRQQLDIRFSPHYFRDKRCIDIACGAGRWTKTLQALGGRVKSIDISEHGLKSVARFNPDVERLNLFDIANRPELHEQFDFALCWGVVMSTHDPKVAFANAARTVRRGGSLYVMVYAPTQHASPEILRARAEFHSRPRTLAEKLEFAYAKAGDPANAINYLDMLNPFYNWVVEEETIHGWFRQNGFINVVTLNGSEVNPVAYHVLGTNRDYAPRMYDDGGVRVPQVRDYDAATIRPLPPALRREHGYAWQVSLPEWAAAADTPDTPARSRLVVLENGRALPFGHALHDEIRTQGLGTYSHWNDYLLLSTSDNSDPTTNGRVYEIALAR